MSLCPRRLEPDVRLAAASWVSDAMLMLMAMLMAPVCAYAEGLAKAPSHGAALQKTPYPVHITRYRTEGVVMCSDRAPWPVLPARVRPNVSRSAAGFVHSMSRRQSAWYNA
jgi:hypothetical protein